MKNAVIITAKGGNSSVQNKNIIPVLSVPVVIYAMRAAKQSSLTHGVFVSTEDRRISDLVEKEGIGLIARPAALSGPESQHKDVIRHAVEELRSAHPGLENCVVLLGNTVMITPGLIDKAFRMLESGDCDSCLSVWRAQDDHPYRALRSTPNGYVESFLKVPCDSNRQSYPTVFYYDQGVWGFKVDCAIKQEGPVPWVWLGRRCRMIERPWVTGRDIHSWIDVSASVWYLNAIQSNDFLDYAE